MIRVYDFDYNLLGETEHALSSEWELKFNDIGSYEGSFDINSDFTKIFAENKYLLLTEDENQAICVGRKISDKLTIYGRTPEWILSKRVVLPFKTSEIFGTDSYTDPETIILYLLNNVYKEPKMISESGEISEEINQAAVCDDFIIPESVGAPLLNRHFWRNSANTLSDVVRDLCDIWGCGYKLRFNFLEKCWQFSFEFGKDIDLVISKSLKNAYDMSFNDSILDSAKCGIFKIYSNTEAEEQSYGCVSNTAREEKGILYWETIFASASGLSEAEKLIKKCYEDRTIDCEINGAKYGKDYILGDRLRVQFEAGPFRQTLRLKVSGVSIISASSGKSIKPIFTAI